VQAPGLLGLDRLDGVTAAQSFGDDPVGDLDLFGLVVELVVLVKNRGRQLTVLDMLLYQMGADPGEPGPGSRSNYRCPTPWPALAPTSLGAS
jgi:hypothetical protein